MSTLIRFLFIIPVILTPSSYGAEELDAIEVKSGKDPSDFNLGSSEYLNDLKTPVAEALKDINGVNASQNGGPGSRISYFIRGTESRHVVFTLDSLKLNDSSNVDRQFDAAFITSPFLKDLTLYKGPQAVLFGSDALGGLIEMRTRKGEDPGTIRLNISAGSFGTVDSSLGQDWKKGIHQGTLTASHMRTDGLSRLNKKRFEASERDGAEVIQLSSSSRHKWNEKWSSDFLFSFLTAENELDGATDDNRDDESMSDQYMIQQKTSFNLDSNSSLSLRNGLSRHQREIRDFRGETAFDGDLTQHELIHRKDSGVWSTLFGLSHEEEAYKDKALDKNTQLESVFGQVAWKKNGTLLQGGIRAEHHILYHGFQTGSAGISQTLNSETFSLQYSQGFKAPSLYQLHAPPIQGYSKVGNKDLVPERNHAWEARWAHENELLDLSMSLFQNRLSNLIAFTNKGYENQMRFIAEGVEINGDLKLDKLRIRPGYTRQEFREEEEAVLRRARHQFNLGVTWFVQEELEIAAMLKALSSRKDKSVNGDVVKLNGFETVDLGVRYQKSKSSFGVKIINIFDREYEELYGYNIMPRSYFLNFGHEFN